MKRFVYFILAVWLLNAALPVRAHGYLVRAIPENRAVLERSPTRLQYWFSESLEPRFSSLNLRDSAGNVLASGTVDTQNRALLTLQLPPESLPDGAYIVELRPAFGDAHVVVESRVFFIGEEVGGITGTAADTTAQPFEVIWKALLLGATFLLFGVFTLYSIVFVPAWGSSAHPFGLLPPRVMRRLNQLVWVGIGLAFTAQWLALLQQTMLFFNVDAGRVLTSDLWQLVLAGSRFGDVWNARMLMLVLLAALQVGSQYFRQEMPFVVRAAWNASVWLLALMIGAQAVISHASGSLVLPWIALIMHWLHSLSVAFWVGGIIVLVLVLPGALQPYTGEDRRAALLAVMGRFSRLLAGVLLLVITTGIYNATNWFFTPADVATPYGAALGLKLLMTLLLVGFGAAHHLVLHPALAVRLEQVLGKWLSMPLEMRVVQRYYHARLWLEQFGVSLRLETLVGIVTLILAALLSATPIPQPEFLQADVTPLSQTQQTGDLTVTLTISPGAPGLNTFDVVVQRDDNPVTDALVEMQIVAPERDNRTRWLPVAAVDQGLYVTTESGIEQAGRWWTLLDITLDGERQRAFFEWQISADAAIQIARPLALGNGIALLLVVSTLSYMLYPGVRATLRRLNWQPLTLFVVFGVIVISFGLLGFSIWIIDWQTLQTAARLNPPPSIVNSVPPDAASLGRGEQLFNTVCGDWQAAESFPILMQSLDILRDDALYQIPAAGWRTIPPCTGELSKTQRWDVVNYLRTLPD